ncbi:MAG: PAS domain S-box protein [Chloroflexi bacterium]|nr:PAS domain S-box protein [Chloroflexota bacterium]
MTSFWHWLQMGRRLIAYGMVAANTAAHLWFIDPIYMGTSVSLYFVPIAYEAVFYGLRAALVLSFLTVLSIAPHILLYHGFYGQVTELVELAALVMVGALIGWQSDRQRWQRRSLSALNAIASATSESLDLREILQRALDQVTKVLAVDGVWISLVDNDPDHPVLAAHQGMAPPRFEGAEGRALKECRDSVMIKSEKACLCENLDEEAWLGNGKAKGSITVFMVPLRSRDQVLGSLGVVLLSPRRLKGDDRGLLTAIGHDVAVAVHNAQLFQRETETLGMYRTLLEKSSDAIFLLDEGGNITIANDAACALTGYNREELLGTNITVLFSPDLVAPILTTSSTMGQPKEEELRRKDGLSRTVEVSVVRVGPEVDHATLQLVLRDVTEQRRAQESLRRYVRAVTKAQEDERRRIARELHDDTAQTLVILSRHLDLLSAGKKRPSPDLRTQLEELRELANNSLEGVRRFSQDLRPSLLDDLGLIPALEWLGDRVRELTNVAPYIEITGEKRRLPPEVELALFRIVQEALNNIAKHAQATEVVVSVSLGEDRVNITVSDNGRGFEIPSNWVEGAAEGRLGLLGMRERAQLVGGFLTIESAQGKGTTISVEVPI